ncbi:MAG TPA: sodium:proton antiporter, partial [Chloroflexia bacterium]|nr:sodium:proton antiporter [Chloroflexia bacterium]
GLLGTIVGRLVVYLRENHREALGLDDFLALGLIALSYGVALMAHTYGFLAVFAAGLALRRIEMLSSGDKPPEEVMAVTRAVENEEKEEIATDPEKASAYMAEAVLGFNEQLERIGEVGVVVLVGGLLTWDLLPLEAWWFVPLLFLVIRPISVEVGLIGSSVAPLQRRLMSWFGIRGIGSVYYLMYAIHNGVPEEASQQLLSLVLTGVAVSVVVHGLSVTPLMELYGRLTSRDRRNRQDAKDAKDHAK